MVFVDSKKNIESHCWSTNIKDIFLKKVKWWPTYLEGCHSWAAYEVCHPSSETKIAEERSKSVNQFTTIIDVTCKINVVTVVLVECYWQNIPKGLHLKEPYKIVYTKIEKSTCNTMWLTWVLVPSSFDSKLQWIWTTYNTDRQRGSVSNEPETCYLCMQPDCVA